MDICLHAAAVVIRLGAAALTLAWTHSVEKTSWEEDWRLAPAGLVLVESRIESTGAGMEPPPEARFDGQWWRWRPMLPPLPMLALRRSNAAGDWRICTAGGCRTLGALIAPQEADPVILAACP